jgi:lipoprotein-releasing system permease protein
VIPLIAVAAVALCVALVIIVVSVMTGFLDMVRSSGRTLMGDVIVSYKVAGIPHYERLIEHIENLPEASAATPVVDSWGLLKMPYPDGPNKETETVQVWGIEPESFADVTDYAQTLWWRPLTPAEETTAREDDLRRRVTPQVRDNGLSLHDDRSGTGGMVLGIHVSQANERKHDGTYEPMRGGYWWMPRFEVTLTTLPLAAGSALDPESRIFPVVNEFMSGVYLIDDTRIMVPLGIAQQMLHLEEADYLDENDEPIGVDPARATMVLVRAVDGVEPVTLRRAVQDAYDAFRAEIVADDTVIVRPPDRGYGLTINTWEEQQAQFIGPIEKERELMRTLFSLVYLVCAGLVLAIFWAIVYEKTRDIGILRSIGASRIGISWIFLRYGLVVGVLGAIFGLGLASLVVHNINTIHGAMGDPPVWLAWVVGASALAALAVTIVRAAGGGLLPLVLGALVTLTLAGACAIILVVRSFGGVTIWDPAVYYFSVIPNDVDMSAAFGTMIGAVIFSLVGAFLPAAKAADTDPVKALRYE